MMYIGFPFNTVFWIVVTMFATGISAWVLLSRGAYRLSLPRSIEQNWRWGVGIALAVWLLIRLALSIFPPGSGSIAMQFTISLTSAGLGLLIGLLPLLISQTYRRIVHGVPGTWLIGVQAIRLGGFFFLALADMKLLPAGFAIPAGYGDMIAGLLALGMVVLLRQQKTYARALAVAFNLYGLTDMIVAITTGTIFLRSFTLQALTSGMPLGYLNFVLLIPSFAVPVFAVLHLYSLYQLRSVKERQAERATPNQPVQSLTR